MTSLCAAVQAKPKVSLFSFASPRVGNYTFGQTMRKRVAVMRVVNKGDVVPLVPGARQALFGRLQGARTTCAALMQLLWQNKRCI